MKSIIKNASWDIALRQHTCKSNSRHCIKQGERRLKIKEGRKISYYCNNCAEKILSNGLNKIIELSKIS